MTYDPHQNPYSAPSYHQPGKPAFEKKSPQDVRGLLTWHLVYIICNCMVAMIIVVFGALHILFPEDFDPKTPPEVNMIVGIFYAAIGCVIAMLHAMAGMFRKGAAGWTFNVVVISLGIFCGCWPASVAMLIFWVKYRDGIVAA